MKKLKFLLIIMIFSLSLGVVTTKSFNSQVEVFAETIKDEREFKAVWMSRLIGDAIYNNEAQFKNDMRYSLDILEHYGLNALIFHVRTHNNAFYESNLNPVASWWAGADFADFDPLSWLIAETHKRGIEFHAWMNPYRVGTAYQTGTLPPANPQNNPNNLIVEGGSTILNPAKEEVRQHIYDTITEFTTLYPQVDAIHFDDYFYINTTAAPTNADTRRNHITEMIEGVKNTLNIFNEENNTTIQFGISPTGIWQNGNGVVTYGPDGRPITSGSNTTGYAHYGDPLYADTVKWASDGSIDYLIPQTYWARNLSAARYEPLMNWWNAVFKNLDVNLYSGLGVYMADSTSNNGWADDMYELASQLNIIDGLNKVDGYSIYSFKHLKNGYTNSTLKSGQQIRNAYNNPLRRKIKVLPEVRSMTPVIPGQVGGVNHSNGTLSWEPTTNAKFYYIYRSESELTYSSDEIVGVVGNNDLTFETGDSTNIFNYGVRALSPTNHLSEIPELPQLPVYTINYFLNGGKFTGNYSSRDEMIIDFLTDFYEFVNPAVDLNTFMHGYGNTSGFDGLYDSEEYFNQLYNTNDKSINPGTNKFINQPEYNKWVPLFDLIDEYVTAVNSDQDFWGSKYVGRLRIKNFFIKYNYGNSTIDPLLNIIPEGLKTGETIIYEYNEETTVLLPTPEKTGYTFLGWYTNSNFTGAKVTSIPIGSTGDKTFYAKWEKIEVPENVTITFNLGYNNEYLPPKTITFGDNVSRPTNPTRTGYIFLGWYFDGSLYDFNLPVTADIELVANWKKETVTITFDLSYGEDLPETLTIDKGTLLNEPTKPTRSGYDFLGWYIEGTETLFNFPSVINENVSLYAKWEKIINYYSVMFDVAGGSPKPVSQTVEEYTRVVKPLDPTKEGYVFLGWYLNNNIYNFNNLVTSNFTLVAKWEEIAQVEYVTINFNINYQGGVNPSDITIIKDTNLNSLPTVNREGFIFKGWYLNGELFDLNSKVNNDITLIAKWSEIIIEGAVTATQGASIRKTGTQGLRFYAQISNEYRNNTHGFYLIYGLTTKEELQQKINNSTGDNIYINGKIVFKKEVPGVTLDNMFSIVLTGIPLQGYLDIITVVPYVVIEDNTFLADDVVTRSIGEVALNGYKDTGLFKDIIDDIDNNVYLFNDSSLSVIKSSIYTTDIDYLKEEFINDWNTKFNTSWNILDAKTFYESASVGGQRRITNSKNLANTNLYKFFNDETYKPKWDWLLYFLESVDYTIHTTRQIGAVLGDGTNSKEDNASNKGVLYNGEHLSYSISNFFNKDYRRGSYTAIDFTNPSIYDTLGDFNHGSLVENFYGKNYVMKNGVIVLEEINENPGSGLAYKYFDGNNYYNPGSTYQVFEEVQFTVELVNVGEKDTITYHLNGGSFYQYNTKEEMISDFIIDFNNFFSEEFFDGKIVNDEEVYIGYVTKEQFFNMTYAYNVPTFFASEEYGDKWSWMKSYILQVATDQGHQSSGPLEEGHDNTWRASIDAFLNEKQRSEWPHSADYREEPAKNGFWDLLVCEGPLVYDSNTELLLPVPVKFGSTFLGWYLNEDFSGSPITKILIGTTGDIVLYAKWE